MKQYIKHDEWSIIEEGFNPEYNEVSESIFSIGNGRMGQRANFEEKYSGKSLQGNYVAGVYYPDKTRVGWWKNGYPEYFAKVLNAANWIGIHVVLDGIEVDLAKNKVIDFRRELNMREGFLDRCATVEIATNKQVVIDSTRFCSIVDDEVGVIKYQLKPGFSGSANITPFVDVDVMNKDANYDEKFWIDVTKEVSSGRGWLIAETKKTAFQVCTGMRVEIYKNGQKLDIPATTESREKYISNTYTLHFQANDEITILKYAANISSENHPKSTLSQVCEFVLDKAVSKGYDTMKLEQAQAWEKKWEHSDIIIKGDVSAQQGIRFNIFQLHQTYTGEDERLNIGPKGFTGEKYGGSTYWDTEAYCLPFYLSTAPQQVAKNLLVYRYKHLDRAIENAAKLGFTNGAALYPMVTMNGEECHNEWEITFEEIHRNGAIAYAVYDYINYTGDHSYLAEYGLEVLIGITRFWAQRVNWSEDKQQFVMLGVTGPNEYENNVNNNWYTLKMADWTLKYTAEAISDVRKNHPDRYEAILKKTCFQETEIAEWKRITDHLYFPTDSKRGIFLQQDGFLDKDIIPVSKLDKSQRPINQKWSWDRILRSCYIKQADTLQGIYLFEDEYDIDTIKRNFDFYEPLTVHESSLSPCVHAIIAAKLGYKEKAYEMYLRTARLDLDDYNNDTEDGCHTTSMAGTWMAVVKGFGGMRIRNGELHLDPYLPENWDAYSFKIGFRGAHLQIKVAKSGVSITNDSVHQIALYLKGEKRIIEPAMELTAV
jgi:maltose phosphorylase